jgi:hypothetical protein
VSPEVSPDGTKIMFFSERDLFSIDLFLADARTGEIIRKVTDTATDAHYESLQFLSSAGAWDATSTRFAFPGISRGEPILTIVNADTGRRERESAPAGGGRGAEPDVRARRAAHRVLGADRRLHRPVRLRPGRQPADADDERSLLGAAPVVVAGRTPHRVRHRSVLDRARPYRHRRSADRLDRRAVARVREVAGFEGAKNISPKWAADGRSLFFLSNREGITNLYRAPIDGGPVTQITNLLTGISGFTGLSPAMSFGGGRVVFSAYENDGYSIYAIDDATRLAGTALVELPRHAAVLPPRTEPAGPVHAAIQDVTLGLPTADAVPAEAEPYRPRLSLDFAGQPSIGVGVDPFGTYAAGGVSFLFSDMLGNHTVATSAQVTNRFDEFGGGVMYLNRKHRWNWGVSLDQTPYVARAFQAGRGVVDGQDVYIENEYRILQTDRSLAGMVSYPFSRAMRLEVNGGLRQIG